MSNEARVRQPRAWLDVGGGGINLLHCVVQQTRSGASEFTADMALDDPSNPGASFWSCTAPINASISATNGDGSSGTVELIRGEIDHVNIDWDKRIVSVHGRDSTGAMLDTRIQQGLPNQTYAQILKQITDNHNLTLHLDGDASAKAGTTFNFQEYQFQADVENEWDVVQHIAEMLGLHAYVYGDQLYLTQPGSTEGGSYAVTYTPPTNETYATGNFIGLRTSVDVNIAKGGKSIAATHHTNAKESYTAEQDYRSIGGVGGNGL